jgi:hypothetical protein
MVGDFGVGKSSFIKRHINGFLAKKFLKDHGCHVVPILFSTNKSSVDLQVAVFYFLFLFGRCIRKYEQTLISNRYGTVKGKKH